VVRGPDHQHGWIYVAGRNDTLRKVEVTRATVTYDETVPVRLRHKVPRQSLVEGAEIRVTAEPDKDGGWHATEIEIIHLSPQRRRPVASANARTTPI
jgi:hypothetical protein